MAKRGREGLLIGGSRGDDELEKFKLSNPQFGNLRSKDVIQLTDDLVSSLRFQRLAEGRDKDAETAWIEHTPIYHDQYVKDQTLLDITANYSTYIIEALEYGLISQKLFDEVELADSPLDMLRHMNLIGFMACDRINQHLCYPRVTNKLQASYTVTLVGTKVMEKIDAWGQRVHGELLAPSDQKCSEALELLLEINPYYRTHSKYLLPTIAQVNVRVGRPADGSSVDKDAMIKVVDEATLDVATREPEDFDHLREHEPSVLSLFSKSYFFGEGIQFEYMGYEELQKASVTDIHQQIATAEGYLKDYPKWVEYLEKSKEVLTAQEQLGWKKKLKKFEELQTAKDFWANIIHKIFHEWTKDERDPETTLEEQFHFLEILMKHPNTICSYIDDGDYLDLQELSLHEKLAEPDTDKIAKALQAFDEGLQAGKRGEPYSVGSNEDDTEPYSVESSEPELDPEKLEFVSECLQEFDEDGTGINLKETLLFLDCCENHKSKKTIKFRRNAYSGEYNKIEVPLRVAQPSKYFISSVINVEHPSGKTKPPPAHPVYQSWVKQFKNIEERESDGVKYMQRVTASVMDNITAWEMANWLLTKLPKKTAVRIELIKRERKLAQEGYEWVKANQEDRF